MVVADLPLPQTPRALRRALLPKQSMLLSHNSLLHPLPRQRLLTQHLFHRPLLKLPSRTRDPALQTKEATMEVWYRAAMVASSFQVATWIKKIV